MAKRIILVVVIVAVLAAGGWWAWTTYGDTEAPEDAFLGGSGTVEADEVTVSSVIAGRIESVTATEGAEVASGTVLFSLDSAVLDLQVQQAEAGVRGAEAALSKVKADDGTKAEVNQAKARVDQAKAALEMARAQAGYAQVEAAVSGVITQVTASAGENAAPGKTLAKIADLKRLHVSVYISETEIGQIKLDQWATVTTDSSSREFDARVTYIASQAEFTPSNIETKDQRVKLVYEVRLDIPDSGDVLKPGMPVDVRFK
ncbi:MAG: efflux RND transporter periplasmic adaptor subunit [Actinomycetota bacterium]|nr:efflux RND transporter periplasmic adaptor subunit [Actinomycetota bacterium]